MSHASLDHTAGCQCWCDDLQEDDVIGILGKNEKISHLKPLGDRILIKVRRHSLAQAAACEA